MPAVSLVARGTDSIRTGLSITPPRVVDHASMPPHAPRTGARMPALSRIGARRNSGHAQCLCSRKLCPQRNSVNHRINQRAPRSGTRLRFGPSRTLPAATEENDLGTDLTRVCAMACTESSRLCARVERLCQFGHFVQLRRRVSTTACVKSRPATTRATGCALLQPCQNKTNTRDSRIGLARATSTMQTQMPGSLTDYQIDPSRLVEDDIY